MRKLREIIGWTLVVLAVALLIGILLPPTCDRVSQPEAHTRNLSNAKQLATGVQLYALDHDGRFPMHLSELVPDYIPADTFDALLYRAKAGDQDDLHLQFDWLYFGAFFDEKTAPSIIVASPQTTGFKGKLPKRIVVAADLTASIISDDQYQIELKKTIEAMHQRARSTGLESKPNAEPANPNSEPK